MIQDIRPSVFSNRFTTRMPALDSSVFFFRGDAVLAAYDAEKKALRFPRWQECASNICPTYAFSIDGRSYFLSPEAEDTPEGYTLFTIKEIRGLNLSSNREIFAVYSAYHLWKWYSSSRYCGRCGARTEHDKTERAMVCPACGEKTYPRINPAVIVGVTNGEKLLLTKYRTGFAHNALVAGFTEFGETLEETVQREVMEEVGLNVKNIRFYKSQPWGVAQDILAGFFCQVDGDPAIHMDENELKYAEWVRQEDVTLQPNDYSLTNEMMKLFKEGKLEDYYWQEPMPY